MARAGLPSTGDVGEHGVAQSLEDLRLAEARLDRRDDGRRDLASRDRAALRYVAERADGGEPATPTELAEHLGISRSAVTALVTRLVAAGSIATRIHVTDGRSKLLQPMQRTTGVDDHDLLGESIREAVATLSEQDAGTVRDFLELLREIVDRKAAHARRQAADAD